MTDVTTELTDNVLHLTINRPAVGNSLNRNVMDALDDAFSRLAADRSIRAMVMTGAGERAFCTGADLASGGLFDMDYASPTVEFARILRKARSLNTPIIGRINGHCLAGGMGLLAICDLAIATEGAKFGLPEVKVGVFPMMVLAELRDMVGRRALNDLCLTGRLIDAPTALDIGLLNKVVPAVDLDLEVEAVVKAIVANAPVAISRGIYTLKRIGTLPFEECISFTEGQIGLLAVTEDAQEGQAAFREKRTPVWQGK